MRNFLVIALSVLALWATDAAAQQQQGRWLRAETDGFVVYGAISEQRIRGVADELEVFDGLLRRMTGAPAERAPRKLEVFLLSSDGFRDVFPHTRDSIIGYYVARVEQTAAFSIYSNSTGLGAREILFHEYAHHFMFQYFANAYPAWYVEGFAELVSTASLGTERIVIGRSSAGRLYALQNETWMPMEQLIAAMPLTLSSSDAAKFYAQSWLFAHYILLTGKQEQLLSYVRALRLGEAPGAAFQTGFGMTPDQMQGELRRYFRSNPNAIALTRPAAVERSPVRVTRLPASADDLLPLIARIRTDIREADHAAALQRARELATSFPGDAYAESALAYAEMAIGDNAAARALAGRRLEASPDDVEALYVMGMTYLREAQEASGEARLTLLSEARRQFARAYRNDPNHVPVMFGYVRSYDGVRMNEETAANYMNILLLAHQLAPQIDEISLNAAAALMMHDRNAEAVPLLRAVAYDPHGGSGADAARQMLERAEAALAERTAEAQ